VERQGWCGGRGQAQPVARELLVEGGERGRRGWGRQGMRKTADVTELTKL
jgi:hypothetical protein